MPTVSTATQTEQFLGLLGYEDKLTKLYQRIKIAQANEQQYRVKIEYLEYKNQALERSLFEYELKSRQKQSERNEILLHELITLEEQLEKQRNDVKKQHGKIEQQKRKNSADSKNRKMSKQSETPNNSLVTIKQQPQLQNPPTSKRPSSKQSKSQNPQQSQTRKQSRRPLQSIDQNIQKMTQLQQQIEKQQKNKRVMQLQMKRLRKLNQEYSVKCRKLEKLVDAKSELYGNLSMQLNQNCINYSNYSGLMDDDGEAGVLFH